MKSNNLFQFLFFFLSFYCFGAGMTDSFVIYHSWQFVGQEDFAAMHVATSQRIIPFIVFPTLLMTVVTIIMLWKRPVVIPKRWVMAGLICQLVSWVSSALIQIPMQTKLSQGDRATLEHLISTDWIRVIAWIIYIVIVSRMLMRILAMNNAVNKARQM